MNWNIRVFQFLILLLMLHQQICVAQNNISDEIILEIPIEIDFLLKELFIYKDDLQFINSNKYRCKLEFIEDPNNVSNKFSKYKHLIEKHKNISGLPNFIDTALIFVNERNISKEYELIILAGLDHHNKIHFYFISTNLDLENNYFKEIIFNEDSQFIAIESEYRKKNIQLQFLNPEYTPYKGTLIHTNIRNILPRFQFSLTFSIPSGSSSILYKNTNSTASESVYYGAKITGNIGLKLQMQYFLKKFSTGIFMQYDNLNYEISNQVSIKVSHGGKTSYNYASNGNWPEKYIHYGLVCSYNFLVLDKFFVAPTLYSGLYHYPNQPKPFDNLLQNNTKENFKKRYSLGGGLYFKIPVYKNFWFTAGYIYQNNHFDASTYFIEIDKNSYQSRQEFFRIELGTSIVL